MKKAKQSDGYLVFAILIIALVLIIASVVKNKNFEKSLNEGSVSGSSEKVENDSLENLRKVYEEEKNISLDNVEPRFDVYENSDLGFRLAYPVGYELNDLGGGVEIVSKSKKGKVIVTVSGSDYEVKVESGGVSDKDARILNNVAEFVESSFEFVTSGYDEKQLKERFSKDTQGVNKY